MDEPPPPPPPPHGSSPRPPGAGLPDGNYDIFIIPPHSSGSGFLYLPSMQPHRNSFLAGVASTLLAVGLYTLVTPVIKQWLALIAAGGAGIGVTILVVAVGSIAWVLGKTQAESSAGPKSENGGSAGGNGPHQRSKYTGPPPNGWQQAHPPPPQPEYQAPPPPPPPQPEPEPQPKATPKANDTKSAWEKAREETRKREEERRRAEELKRKREEAQKVRDEAERAAKAKAEKEKWEQARARERETREREARERIAREREARVKEQREKEQKERDVREEAEKKKADWEKAKLAEKEKADRIRGAAAAASVRSTPTKTPTSPAKYERPTAKSQAGTDTPYSYRPYDPPKTAAFTSSASSISGLSESSYAHSVSTARTTPPPSMRGPYSTTDPDKIQIKAVYQFSDSSPTKPISQLVANEGSVTDGLILHIKTEGLFIDDDIRGVPQREWDVKAWTLKLVEDGMAKAPGCVLHVVRATTRDTENKKYTFVLDETEAWKVAIGLQRLRKGSQVRSLGMNGMKDADAKRLLGSLGWL